MSFSSLHGLVAPNCVIPIASRTGGGHAPTSKPSGGGDGGDADERTEVDGKAVDGEALPPAA
jgi:hypothetical protein